MNEQEFLASADPAAMLAHVRGKVSDRKLRLFACSCCRAVWGHLTDPRNRNAVEVAERYADGLAMPDEVLVARAAAERVYYGDGEGVASFESELAVRVLGPIWELTENSGLPRWFGASTELASSQAALLREIAGNPFRPQSSLWAINSEWGYWYGGGGRGRIDMEEPPRLLPASPWITWNDGAVPKIARVIYDTRDWDLMPQLADAIEEAGCEDEAILRHCRGEERCYRCDEGGEVSTDDGDWGPCPVCGGSRWTKLRGPHVRGCAVLDLLLGKE